VELQSERVEVLSRQLVANQERLAKINGLTMAGSVVCTGLGLAAILSFAGSAVVRGELAGPLLVMLLLFAAASFEAATGMPAALQLLPGCQESMRRILELADTPAPVAEPCSPLLPPTGFGIDFADLSFSYRPGEPVLEHFFLTIAPGERVALAGPSGCGKSSVIELLLCFRPCQGRITIGNIDVQQLASDDLLALVAVVRQQPHLFNSTIRANILLAKPSASEEELQRVLADVALSDWVASLPEGVETRVGEGGNAVSGGEARRIALARALLKDAPILILDEPTEGLDLATERKVVARLTERLQGKTVLIISHRPTCLELADRVVWMPRLGTPSAVMGT
jgi:ATP-binding cassette subfamily C protein CydC